MSNSSRKTPPELLSTLLTHRDRFFSFVVSRLGDRAAAEDVLQDAYAKVVAGAAPAGSPEQAISWFYRVLRNGATDRHRREQARQRSVAAFSQDPTNQPDAHSAPRRLCSCTRAALASLNARYIEIINRVEVEGQSLAAFGRAHGISPGNAAVRLHRARRMLAERLKGICQTCALDACSDCHCKGSAPAAF